MPACTASAAAKAGVRAAWADAGLTVTRRRARLTLYAQPWRDTSGPLYPNPPEGD